MRLLDLKKIKNSQKFKKANVNTENRTEKTRLTGVDLFRGIAVLAVIILHSDEGISTSPQGWETILEFSGFAVPFFLAASFYLAFTKIYVNKGNFVLKERLVRLLTPYLFWTIFFASGLAVLIFD